MRTHTTCEGLLPPCHPSPPKKGGLRMSTLRFLLLLVGHDILLPPTNRRDTDPTFPPMPRLTSSFCYLLQPPFMMLPRHSAQPPTRPHPHTRSTPPRPSLRSLTFTFVHSVLSTEPTRPKYFFLVLAFSFLLSFLRGAL